MADSQEVSNIRRILRQFSERTNCEIAIDRMHQWLYATDASIYHELPIGVVFPETAEQVVALVHLANENGFSLIPRAAGTSLAGQCVGNGVVVDVSRKMNGIGDVNKAEKWVDVEPGIVRDALNQELGKDGLFFGPNTSTANRATIGGMVGNNSSGSHSLTYGTTRDQVLSISCVLSDGSEVTFHRDGTFTPENNALATKLLDQLIDWQNDELLVGEIRKQYPKPSIHRRNTGYALDEALDVYSEATEAPNIVKMLCGSEGTLAFITKIRLRLHEVPPKHTGLVCYHFDSLDESLKAVPEILTTDPRALELMDQKILDCTADHPEISKYRFFIKGNPAALLISEHAADSEDELSRQLETAEKSIGKQIATAHVSIVTGTDCQKVWELRKAGLGILSNYPGNKKPVALVEDTAVDPIDLAEYIRAFDGILKKHKQEGVYYAHAGAGELHIRPVLDLSSNEDIELMKTIAKESATLVKEYQGSLSGEHGDGRLRAPFIQSYYGEQIYQKFKELKELWDPAGVFNPGKILDAPPIENNLRNLNHSNNEVLKSIRDEALKCTGSGDCRKFSLSGGTMCPSYRATRNEKDSTRGRANVLLNATQGKQNIEELPFEPMMDALDLCLSCKACKTECPSGVNMALLKAQSLQAYYKKNGVPGKVRRMASVDRISKLGNIWPSAYNWIAGMDWTKKWNGIAPERSTPALSKETAWQWWKRNKPEILPSKPVREIQFYLDEFTNYYSPKIAIKAIQLLCHFNIKVNIDRQMTSARSYISKGLTDKAQAIIDDNIKHYKPLISNKIPLVGIEPSAVLGFRDDFIDLCSAHLKEEATTLANHVFTIEEYIHQLMTENLILSDHFDDSKQEILYHGHCHQKSLSSSHYALEILNIPSNFTATEIPSGCCGMAGSFGYEEEHYDISQKIAEDVLFPYIRKHGKDSMISASGFSCHHQILDGLQITTKHPIEILHNALLPVKG